MQGPRQPFHGWCKRQVGVWKATAHLVAGMGIYIATFMATVDGEVKSQKLSKLSIGISLPVGEIVWPVQLRVNVSNTAALPVEILATTQGSFEVKSIQS